MRRSNPLSEYFQYLKLSDEFGADSYLMDFLENLDMTVYGMPVAPSKLRKLRHDLRRQGYQFD